MVCSRSPVQQYVTELGSFRRERGLLPEHVDRWPHADDDTNSNSMLTSPTRRTWRSTTSKSRGKSKGCSIFWVVRTRPGGGSGTSDCAKNIHANLGMDEVDL